jgi:putative sigma-54 modulation protein
MEAEFTGRKVTITPQLRKIAEEGLARIERVVGRNASAHVILSSQKHREIAEVTIAAKHHTVVGEAEAAQLDAALRLALEKAEKQALRHKKMRVEKKRQSHTIRMDGLETAPPAKTVAVPRSGRSAKKNSGLHVVPSPEALATAPMMLEEAVKEAESRGQEVFVFRDPADGIKVLHLAGDGIVRLIEVP